MKQYKYLLLIAILLSGSSVFSQEVDSAVVEELVADTVAVEEAVEEAVAEQATEDSPVGGVVEGTDEIDDEKNDYEEVVFTDSDTLELYGKTFSGLYDLDDVVPNYSVFITGENHTYTESNARIWLKMIKYLHKNANVRNVMFEYGYSYGWLVNQYLQTGDTNIYNSVKNFAYPEYSEAIKELQKFNASLDSADKLYLVGIDVDRGIYPIVKLLDYLLPDSFDDAHDSIIMHLESMRSIASYNDSKLNLDDENSFVIFNYKTTPTVELVQKNFISWEEEYKKILGENFDLFKETIITRFNQREEWRQYDNDGAAQQYVFRERYMHRVFLEEAAKHEGAWFGQFGRCHTTRNRTTSEGCDWYMFKSLANRIDNTKGGQYKGKILTIAIAYKGDVSLGTEWVQYQDVFEKYFETVPESSVVLLDVKKDPVLDSAFSKDFHYMLLNSNTKRGEAYEDILYDYSAAGSRKSSFKLLLSSTEQTYDFGSLNEALTGPGVSFDNTIANNAQFLNFSFVTGAGIVNKSNTFSYMLPTVMKQTEGLTGANERTVKFSGYKIKSNTLLNLTPGLSLIDLYLGMGTSYEQYRLTITDIDPIGGIGNGSIGDLKSTIYKNPLFGFDLLGGIDLNLSFLTVGYDIGYTFDLSKANWIAGDEKVNGPMTKFRGMYQTYKIGLNF